VPRRGRSGPGCGRVAAGDEDAGVPGPPMSCGGRMTTASFVSRALVGRSVGRRPAGRHLDLDVRGGRGEDPRTRARRGGGARDRDRPRVGGGSGDVGGGGKAPIFSGPVGGAISSASRRVRSIPAVDVLGMGDHVGDRLAPGQLVAVGARRGRMKTTGRSAAGIGPRGVALVELRRQAQAEDVDEAVDGGSSSRSRRRGRRARRSAHRVADDPSRLRPGRGRLEPRPRGLAVGVAYSGRTASRR